MVVVTAVTLVLCCCHVSHNTDGVITGNGGVAVLTG